MELHFTITGCHLIQYYLPPYRRRYRVCWAC